MEDFEICQFSVELLYNWNSIFEGEMSRVRCLINAILLHDIQVAHFGNIFYLFAHFLTDIIPTHFLPAIFKDFQKSKG